MSLKSMEYVPMSICYLRLRAHQLRTGQALPSIYVSSGETLLLLYFGSHIEYRIRCL